MTETPKAWLTRAGRSGERDEWALSSGCTPGGYGEIPDLSECQSLQDVRDVVAAAMPDEKPQARANYAAQLWALRGRMEIGDFVVLPRKATGQLAIGRVAGPYEYVGSEANIDKRHVRTVEWVRTDIPRSTVKQDLLYSLGAFSTYCQVSRNDAATRIAALASGSTDPGVAAGTLPSDSLGDSESALEASDGAVDLEQFARDRIRALIQQEFAGHRMQDLIAAVLAAQGYTCRVAPEGADGGIDILAGSGPLGMDEPRLVVQVKSEQGSVSDPVITQLLGSVSNHQPAQGLLVAWGGLTPPARRTALSNYFRLRIWDSEDVVSQVTAHYTKLPEEIRAELPLKQVWIAVEESS